MSLLARIALRISPRSIAGDGGCCGSGSRPSTASVRIPSTNRRLFTRIRSIPILADGHRQRLLQFLGVDRQHGAGPSLVVLGGLRRVDLDVPPGQQLARADERDAAAEDDDIRGRVRLEAFLDWPVQARDQAARPGRREHQAARPGPGGVHVPADQPEIAQHPGDEHHQGPEQRAGGEPAEAEDQRDTGDRQQDVEQHQQDHQPPVPPAGDGVPGQRYYVDPVGGGDRPQARPDEGGVDIPGERRLQPGVRAQQTVDPGRLRLGRGGRRRR